MKSLNRRKAVFFYLSHMELAVADIIDFPIKRREWLSDEEMFYHTAINQEKVPEHRFVGRWVLAKRPPGPHKIAAAKRELQLLFSGENEEISDRLYKEGLREVATGGNPNYGWQHKYEYGFWRRVYVPRYTDAVQFYAHVQNLTSIVAGEFDCP